MSVGDVASAIVDSLEKNEEVNLVAFAEWCKTATANDGETLFSAIAAPNVPNVKDYQIRFKQFNNAVGNLPSFIDLVNRITDKRNSEKE
jgi:hypothetical protein